jgi:hypothetical protein
MCAEHKKGRLAAAFFNETRNKRAVARASSVQMKSSER